MKTRTALKRLYNRLRGFFPSPVPKGLTEFETWSARIRDTYNPPGDDRSIRFVLSAMLMRLDPTEAYKADWYFAKSLYRSAAAQVGVYVQETIKNTQRAEFEAQQAANVKAAQEATNAVVNDGKNWF